MVSIHRGNDFCLAITVMQSISMMDSRSRGRCADSPDRRHPGTVRTGNAGHPGFASPGSRKPCRPSANRLRARAEENEAALLHPFGEIGVFRQETIARMDRYRIGDFGGADDRRHVQVTLGGRPMHTVSSAMRTCFSSRPTVEWSATVRMPSSRQARRMRRAISPRLAMTTFSSMATIQ